MDYLEHCTLGTMLSDVVKDLEFLRAAILGHNTADLTMHSGTASKEMAHQRTGDPW